MRGPGPFSVALLGAVAVAALAQMFSEAEPTRWHLHLRRNDARLILAWIAALPLLLGLGVVRERPSLGTLGIAIGVGLSASLVWAAPAETEKLFEMFLEPLAGIVGGFCAAAMLVRRFSPRLARRQGALFLFAFGLAFSTAAGAGWEGWMTIGLPPNYHDEYAYLFQAWTYLDGRFAYPADELSPAFDQVHVLNDAVFASRYFPGTALWLTPFLAFGHPIVAMWTAHGVATGFLALTAARFSRLAGLLTALLVGTAPGMIVFSDALLSTMPTMMALAAFLWAWFGACERPSKRVAAVAGVAIGFAFLCRPLTASGIGFPFAIYSLLRVWRPRSTGERRSIVSMMIGFLAVAAVLPLWGWATIGAVRETPYDVYTRTRTPSHVYGFYNVERGRSRKSEVVFHPYDSWATNLLPEHAWPTVNERIDNALREGAGGRLFAGLLLVLSLASLRGRDDRIALLWLGILGLVLAYAAYWFVGVYGFGYLAEALPFALMIAASTAAWLDERRSRDGLVPFPPIWSILILLRVLSNVGDVIPRNFDPGADAQFARREKKQVVDRENAALRAEGRPLLVLIAADPKTAVHSTLVNNHPRLDGPIVRAWERPELLDALLARYSDRAVYRLEYRGFAQGFEWNRVRGPAPRR
jgi:hypothetical protein